jgi:hypothetical protein
MIKLISVIIKEAEVVEVVQDLDQIVIFHKAGVEVADVDVDLYKVHLLEEVEEHKGHLLVDLLLVDLLLVDLLLPVTEFHQLPE